MYSILIVDDEKVFRQGLKAVLQKSGIPIDRMIECSDGIKALEILKNRDIDLLFTDICMPKMDGITLLREVQKLSCRPITVVVSEHDDFSCAVEAMRMGARDYILKPVDQELLEKRIQEFEEELRQSQVQSAARKRIRYQQLKYLVQNEKVSGRVADDIVRQYQESIFSEAGYYICCLEKQEYHGVENVHFVYLNDVWGNNLFVIDSRMLSWFCSNELQGSYLGFSEIHFGLSSFRQAYEEAYLARKQAFRRMEHRVFYKKRENAVYFLDGEGAEISASGQKSEDNWIKQVAQLIGTDREMEISSLMTKMKRDVYIGSCSMENFEKEIEMLLHTIMYTCQNLLKEKRMDFNRFENIYGYPCLDDFLEELTAWILALQDKLRPQYDDYKNEQKIMQAVQYIEGNYNKDLNMAVVSNFVSMNYSLFSYAFKRYTGMNFVTYVKKLRIGEAQKLLADTDLRVNEISVMVGYENEKHFMKTFKNMCGVSPSEYRRKAHCTTI